MYPAILPLLLSVLPAGGGGGAGRAFPPADDACLFPAGWEYRLDPDEEGEGAAWFRPEAPGPWEALPAGARHRARVLAGGAGGTGGAGGAVWLRAWVNTPPRFRDGPVFLGLARPPWPRETRAWWDGKPVDWLPPAGRAEGAGSTGAAPGAGPRIDILLARLPDGAPVRAGRHLLVLRAPTGRGDLLDPPCLGSGSSVLLAVSGGVVRGWFTPAPGRRAWLVQRYRKWVWPRPMVRDRMWLVRGNAPSPAHAGLVGDRHEPAMTHYGGVILYDGDERRLPRPLAVLVPWVYDPAAGRLYTCEEAPASPRPRWRLRGGHLPIPEISWQAGPVRVDETLYADRFGGRREWAVAFLRIVLTNTSGGEAEAWLYAAVLQRMDRASSAPLQSVSCDPRAGVIRGNGRLLVVSDAAAEAGGGLGFTDGRVGDLSAYARRGLLPAARSARDARGMASAALCYRFRLAPGARREVTLRIPYEYFFPLTKYLRHPPPLSTLTPREIADPLPPEVRLERIERRWRRAVPVRLEIPDAAARDLFYASAFNLLLGVDGETPRGAILSSSAHPGPAVGEILAALAMVGVREEVDRGVRALAAGQDEEGLFAGRGGAAALSQGRIGWGLARACRLRREITLTREVWPVLERAAGVVEASAAAARAPELANSPRFGLADRDLVGFHPALRYEGNWTCAAFLAETARLAEATARPAAGRRLRKAAGMLWADTAASLERLLEGDPRAPLPTGADRRGRPVVPRLPLESALEHAPALTAGMPAGLDPPRERLRRGFLSAFRSGAAGGGWRSAPDRFAGLGGGPAAAMVLLGLRREAFQSLRFLANTQTGPGALSGWDVRIDEAHRVHGRWCRGAGPTDLRSAALYVIALRTMFLSEEGGRSLALLEGVPKEWLLEGRPAAFENAPTHFGLVSVRAVSRLARRRLELEIVAENDPPEGYTLYLPLAGRPRQVMVEGIGPVRAGPFSEGIHLPPGSRQVTVLLDRP